MCYFSILDSVRKNLDHEGEQVKLQLKMKIKQLDSEVAELDMVKQKTKTYK